jgi:hypothetical protein
MCHRTRPIATKRVDEDELSSQELPPVEHFLEHFIVIWTTMPARRGLFNSYNMIRVSFRWSSRLL